MFPTGTNLKKKKKKNSLSLVHEVAFNFAKKTFLFYLIWKTVKFFFLERIPIQRAKTNWLTEMRCSKSSRSKTESTNKFKGGVAVFPKG